MADLGSTRVFGRISVSHEAFFKDDVSVDGMLSADAFVGNGEGLTNIKSTSLSGTIGYGNLPFSSGNVSNWNTAYGWGNHASAGYALASRTITAGTGLTGGGNLTANRTLSVTYGTTAGTAAQGNDSRLSNSREWTAATVSQAEAEAGTATTRRAWSSQRVRQNVSAYTEPFTSAEKTKLSGIAAGAQVNVATNLGQSRNATSYTITSSTGNNTVLAAATTSNAGVMVAADKSKLDGIAAGAQVNVGTNLGSSGTGATRTITSSTGSNTSITYSAADVGAVPTGRTISSGDGLSGGGNLGSNRTLSVDSTVVRTSGDQSIGGVKTLTNNLIVSSPSRTSYNLETAQLQIAPSSLVDNGLISIALKNTTTTNYGWSINVDRSVSSAMPSDFTIRQHNSTVEGVEFFKISNSGVISGNGSGLTNLSGTHSSLRAQATTKADVGLSNAPNWSGSTSTSLGTSNTVIPSQGAVKSYVDSGLSGKANTTGTYSIRATGTTKADVGLSGIPNTNGSTANFLRGDGTWVTPPNTNTTYSEITTAEISSGTASTLRTITGRRIKYAVDTHGLKIGTTASTAKAGNWTPAVADIPNLPASKITSGTISTARLPASALIGDTTYSAGTGLSLSGTTFTNTAPHVGTNLGVTGTGSTRTITSSTGSNADISFTAPDVGALYAGTSSGQARTNSQNDSRFAQLSGGNWGSAGLGGYGLGSTGASDPSDANDIAGSGFYRANSGMANNPNSSAGIIIHGSSYTSQQMQFYTQSSSGELKFRTKFSTWLNWQKVWTDQDLVNPAQMNTTNSGSFTASGNITAYSDARLKENIEVIPDALEKVQKLNGYTFTRNDQEDKEKHHTGVIAQEVLEVLPEAVLGGPTEEDPDGKYSVAYGNMVGLLIEAIKEQQKQIDALKPWYKKIYEWVKEKF